MNFSKVLLIFLIRTEEGWVYLKLMDIWKYLKEDMGLREFLNSVHSPFKLVFIYSWWRVVYGHQLHALCALWYTICLGTMDVYIFLSKKLFIEGFWPHYYLKDKVAELDSLYGSQSADFISLVIWYTCASYCVQQSLSKKSYQILGKNMSC